VVAIRPIPISRPQKKFRESKAWMTGFVAGRGAGKSKIGCIHISQTAKAGEPWMAISPDNNMIRETTLPTFIETVRFSKQYIDHVLSPTPRVWFKTIDGRGKAEVVFKGAEVPDKLRGPSKAGVWFDEASIIHKDAFDIAIACCRYRGKMGPVLATFTPRGFAHWTFDSFYSGVDETLIGTDGCSAEGLEWFQGKPYRANKDTYLVRCSTRENPFAPPEYYERIARNYSTSLAMQELEGDFIELSGMIFRREWFSQTVEHAPADAMRVRFWDKAACLIPGTIVLTSRGLIPIETVNTSDKVLTRDGWKSLSFAGQTKIANELVTVLFDDGTHVTCTPEHRIWCNRTCTWIEAKDLNGYSGCITQSTTTEEVLSCHDQEVSQPKQSISTGSRTQDTQTVVASVSSDTSMLTSRTKAGNTSTDRYIETSGSIFAVKSPVAITLTTLTETGTTTTSKIFSAFQQKSIEKNTHLKCLIQKLSERQERLLLGLSPYEESSQELASIAGVSIVQGAQLQSIAHLNAIELCETEKQNQSTSSHSQQQSNVEFAGQISWSTERKFTAQQNALGTVETKRLGVPVYDLTVSDGPPEFFANGTLVHNSKDSGCYTVGLLMARDQRGVYYIEDIVRGQWSAHERNNIMLQTARSDAIRYGGEVLTYIEQEGGGDGKTVIDQLIVMLSEFSVYRWSTTGGSMWKTKGNVRLPGDAKVRRARPFSAQCEAGNIRLVLGSSNGRWHRDFCDEMCAFPEFAYADQVDAAASAYNVLQTLSPNFGDYSASRTTEVASSSRYGHTTQVSETDSITRWGDLPWNQLSSDE
jgi:predicted phage terminase large subunit-like protein